jgi:uncharacterized protein (DUF1499 family)
MAALPFRGDLASSQLRLETILRGLPRTTIVLREAGYLRVEFRSLIFRFVDEAEFSFDEITRLIHFRSGARTGYSDFGVNRARMEKIAAALRSGSA